MTGNRPPTPTNAVTTLFTLKADGQVSQLKLDRVGNFRVCAHTTGLRNRLYSMCRNTNHWQHKLLLTIHAQHSEEYDFGTDFIVENMICPSNNENSGYLLGTALHIPSSAVV